MATSLSVESPAVPLGTTVVAVKAREALSEPFLLEVGLRTRGARIDPEAAIGAPMQVVVREGGLLGALAEPHVWNGVVAAVEILHEAGEVAYVRATVVPRLWHLKDTFHSRVFTVGTVPEIVEAVLLDEGLSSRDLRIELRGSYPSLDHVCMFRESSFDFVSRLLEREGITYFFEHEGDRHVMVLVDDLGAHPEARGPVAMRPYAEDESATKEGLWELSYRHDALPSEVRVTDYDYLRPSAGIAASAAIQRRRTGVVVEHAAFVSLPDEERRYADLRAEELACREQWFQGWGRVAGLRAGHTFAVTGHELGRLDDEYLVVELDTEVFELEAGDGAEQVAWLTRLFGIEGRRGTVVSVGAIPKSTQFRPRRVTPWPRVHGVVDGVVDGMGSSSYAQIDAQGRYKVRLRFDESDLLDGQASTWIRMLQPHGGSQEGFHFPLRKGTEVQVAFLGGDPDRPVIVGAAPDAVQRSKVRRGNATQNVIHTGGDNTITMEDAIGGMYVTTFSPPMNSTLHLGTGENQIDLRTDGHGHLHIGQSLDVDVHGAKIEAVQGTLTETYVGQQRLTVSGAVTRTMATSLDQSIAGPVTEHVTATFDETVAASVTELYQTGQSTTVTGGVTQTFGASLTHTVNGGALTESIAASRTRMVASTLTHDVSGHVEEELGPTFRLVAGDYTETVGGTYTIEAPSLQVVCVKRTWVDGALDVIEGVQTITDAIDTILNGDHLRITGASASATGFSLKVVGSSNVKDSIRLTATGASVSAIGVQMRKHALLMRTHAIDVGFKGIYIIL